MITLILNIQNHKGVDMLGLRFPYHEPLISEVKKLQGAAWSASKRVWMLPYAPGLIETVKNALGHLAQIDDTEALENAKRIESERCATETYAEKLETYSLWLSSKRYSTNTIKSYMDAVRIFLRFMNGKTVEEIGQADFILFNNEYILKRGYSAAYQNQMGTG